MLSIDVELPELFDEETGRFVKIGKVHLQLEHSLISLAKWEAKWHIPFLTENQKTNKQIRDYIRCMTLTQHVDPVVYDHIPFQTIETIFDYIEAPMTATTFRKDSENGKWLKRRNEIVTAELIYYWMIELGIPIQLEKWHLNRLITLIRVINIKRTPPKKMSEKDILARNRKINASNRARLKSKG